MLLPDASALDSLVGLLHFFDGVPNERLLAVPGATSWLPDLDISMWLGGPCMPIAALAMRTGVICLLVLAEGLTFGLPCWPNSAVSPSAGLKASTGLGGSSVMDAVEFGVMGLVAEVPSQASGA